MNDLISRQETIKYIRENLPLSTFMHRGVKQAEIACWDVCNMIADRVPSAEPERKWIPVIEALPDSNDDVLLQFRSNMAVGYYEDEGWSVATGEDLYSGIDESEDKPIAWMQLPEPYRKEN